jgi:general secretion pathway protein L
LALPPLADADLAQAVQLDVASSSPFPAGQTVYGYVARADDHVAVAITSRPQVDLAQVQARVAGWRPHGGEAPEIWVIPPDTDRSGPIRPIVIGGYGEGARARLAARGFGQHLALIGLGLVLLAALLVTPTAFTRMRAHQALAAQDALQHRTGAPIAAREALLAQVDRMQALRDLVGQQIALPPALDMFTRTVPDGAWLTSLRAEGTKLTLTGSADDAAALVQQLAQQPGVRDARLASPATRAPGASKENFIIEVQLDPARYGLVQGPAGAVSGAAPAVASSVAASAAGLATASATAVTAASAPATLAASIPAPASAPAPVSVSAKGASS